VACFWHICGRRLGLVQRGKVRAAAAGVPSPRHGRGQSDQRDRGGWTRAACRAHGASRFPSFGQHPCKVLLFCLCKILRGSCSTKCPQEVKIRNFKIFKLGWSLYWIGILKLFLLGQEMVFCFRAILNLGMSSISDSNFGQFLSVVRETILGG
jgi:hypothetical protein